MVSSRSSAHTEPEETREQSALRIAKYVVTAIVVIALILALNPTAGVDADERGLVLNWGAVQDTILQPGLHYRIPIMQRIETVKVVPQQFDIDVPVGSAGAITKDNQTIGTTINAYYKYDETQLVNTRRNWTFQKVDSLLKTAMQESFKEVVGEYTIFDIATKQAEIRNKVWERANAKAKGYPAQLTDLRISNYDWNDAFDAQINATMQAAQQVKKAEQELLLAEQEAQKKVKQAEADKQASIARAEGERESSRLHAEGKALEGEGLKKYNESLQANVATEIRLRELEIEKLRVDKWNGSYVANNNYLPIPYNYGAAQGAK